MVFCFFPCKALLMTVDLYTPYEKLGLRNRSVMAPMTRYSCNAAGDPSAAMADYYISRAKGGVGLIIVESCAVNDTDAKGYMNGAQFHTDLHRELWAPIVKSVQQSGSKIWLQLFHAGRLTVREICKTSPISASAIDLYDGESYWRPKINNKVCHFQTRTAFERPLEMTHKDIKRIIKDFAASCKLAEEAGFDGVELHGAHGYLLHQFCNGATNARNDEYNASSFMFIEELVKKCREQVSKEFTLAYRLSVHMVDSSYVRYDESELDFGKLVERLESLGIDVFHSSEMKSGSRMMGGTVSLSELIRQYTRKPLITCGRIRSLERANTILKSNKADLIAFGRLLIPNPDLVNGFRQDGYEAEKFNYEKHIGNLL